MGDRFSCISSSLSSAQFGAKTPKRMKVHRERGRRKGEQPWGSDGVT